MYYINYPIHVSVPNLHQSEYIGLSRHLKYVKVLQFLLLRYFFVDRFESFEKGVLRIWFKPPGDVKRNWFRGHFDWQALSTTMIVSET